MSYTSQANVEASLGRSLTSAEVVLLPLLLDAADAYINNYVHSTFGTPTPSTRYYQGGASIINIDPCYSITALAAVDNYETSLYDYVAGEYYEAGPKNESIKRWLWARGYFPKGLYNIAVSATFSLGAVTNDIVYLATYLITRLLNNNSSGNLSQESIEGYSRTFKEWSESEDSVITATLSKYIQDDVLI